MGVVGIILAAILNLFLQSNALGFAISSLGVLIFAGLTAYDTQQIKDGYYAIRDDSALMAKSAIMGALSLYLDFINMFTSLLSLMGDRE
jgi:FtsH-binding integral membrane protein